MSRNHWHLPGAALFVGLLGLGAWECTGSSADGSAVAVPRPTAYPRIDRYPQSYTPISLPAVSVEVNDSAITEHTVVIANGSHRLTITYPRYNAELYCTCTPVTHAAPLDGILANREERMARNTGGASSELTEWTNDAGIACRMLVTPYGTVTPVQYMATDSARFVISGALYLKGLGKAPDNDSIAPVVRAIETDVFHLLQNLR